MSTLYTGPRGGTYTIVRGRKVYITSGKNTGNRNVLGRAIYIGSKGKLFVVTAGGAKSYKFTRGYKHPVVFEKNNTVPRRSLLMAQVQNIVPILSRRKTSGSKRLKRLMNIVNK